MTEHDLPPWLPRPSGATVRAATTAAEHIPLEVYPEVVRVPLREDPDSHNPTWPSVLRPQWVGWTLCDVIDGHEPFTRDLSSAQFDSLAHVIMEDGEEFAALVADTSGVTEFGQLRAHGHISAERVVPPMGGGVPGFYLVSGAGLVDVQTALSLVMPVSHLWTATWLLRFQDWREETSMLVAGPYGAQQRLAEAGLSSWRLGPEVLWPPSCRHPGRHVSYD